MTAPVKLYIYNTYSKQKEELIPQDPKHVRIYDCGMTVYNYAHIGNLLRYLMSDLFRRVLVYFGYTPYQVQNVTDVGHLTQDDIDQGEDKIMKQARLEGLSPYEIANKYLAAFLVDLDTVRILRPHVMPKATEHVPEMVAMIKKLEAAGYTYEIQDGLYFDTSKFPDYGRLSGNTKEDLQAGARLEVNPEKRHPADFVLWKRVSPDHLMKWESPWGVGCPGWHIECSAMSQKYLGNTLDVHSGGEDNIFPHHESEIAQAEGANGGIKFCRYWLHCRHLLVAGKKMAKREGTQYRLNDLVEQGYTPMAFRFLVLSSHYRKQLNFTFAALQAAQAGIDRIEECLRGLAEVAKAGAATAAVARLVTKTRKAFGRALADDLNTPEALAAVFAFIKEINKRLAASRLTKKDAQRACAFLLTEFNEVFAVLDGTGGKKGSEDPEVKNLLTKRQRVRATKNWAESDRLRQELQKRGVVVKDEKLKGPG